MSLTITFQPIGISIECDKEVSILKAARLAGIGLSAVCGGQSECGSCVVKIRDQGAVNKPTETEVEQLGEQRIKEGFRLACHTIALGMLTIDIPPESLTSHQRLQVEGIENKTEFAPFLQIHDLSLGNVSRLNEGDDWKKVLNSLDLQGIPRPNPVALTGLKKLSDILRNNMGQLRMVVHNDSLVTFCPPDTSVLGLAVDIGTTKIAGYLLDMESGLILAHIGLPNPQITFGEDVMTRITHCIAEKGGIQELQSVLVSTINSLAGDLCIQANQSVTNKNTEQFYKPSQILEAVLVGNTAMHHLLLGLPVKQLGQAPYVPVISDPLNIKAREMDLNSFSEAIVHLPPNIAGFLGSDHVAMLMAANALEESQNTLYMDIGTNTEITLRIGNRLVSCSTASGPAFEGAHIQHGMRAAEGAIESVIIIGDKIQYQTIGNVKPIGICGSGIVDAIAQMLQAGIIRKTGVLEENHALVENGVKRLEMVLVPADKTGHQRTIAITRKDVNEIQLAKGAIQAGIDLLLKETNAVIENVEKIVVAGAFGTYLNIDSAKRIGLIPNLRNDQITQIGNAAGIGAKLALISRHKRLEALRIQEQIEHIELAGKSEFSTLFAKAMFFQSENDG